MKIRFFILMFLRLLGISLMVMLLSSFGINACGDDKKEKSKKITNDESVNKDLPTPPSGWDGLEDWSSSSFKIVEETL